MRPFDKTPSTSFAKLKAGAMSPTGRERAATLEVRK